MDHGNVINLPPPSLPRGYLDGVIVSATIVLSDLPSYFTENAAITVGYLYLVNPDHNGHSESELEPILCTLAYDPERECYHVIPHGGTCPSMRLAGSLYTQLIDEHRKGDA